MIAISGAMIPIPGSFRDPSGRVFERDGRIFRTVNPAAARDFDFVRQTPFYAAAVAEGRLVEARLLGEAEAREIARDAVYVVEHPRLPFVSFPYEWPFPALKSAALLHLDLQLDALSSGVMFSDATAYNVQFVGHRPIFIDTLSLRAYREGELWAGHRQFCEQFLNPLLLRAFLGVTHNAWYRGAQEGIPTADLRRLLPFGRKLSRRVGTHVVLQDVLQRSAGKRSDIDATALRAAGLPRSSMAKLLRGLREWIATLAPRDGSVTTWKDYAHSHSYTSEEAATKKAVIQEFVGAHALKQVWDIGCNTGDYATAALEAGASHVIGFDFDQGALELAFARSVERNLNFLPLFLDAANPSPSQGWAQTERAGLAERGGADGVVALAIVHHLAITGNVPLGRVVEWLVGMAPRGVIEFVPKGDPMVAQLLKFRPDIFPDYHEEAFLAHFGALARIERCTPTSATGRALVEFARHTAR